MSEIKTRAKINIKGRVQGVFFRANAKEMASSLSITGWIKNNRDGSISAVIEGPQDLVEKFLEWCNHGPSTAEVTSVETKWSEPTSEFRQFEIR